MEQHGPIQIIAQSARLRGGFDELPDYGHRAQVSMRDPKLSELDCLIAAFAVGHRTDNSGSRVCALCRECDLNEELISESCSRGCSPETVAYLHRSCIEDWLVARTDLDRHPELCGCGRAVNALLLHRMIEDTAQRAFQSQRGVQLVTSLSTLSRKARFLGLLDAAEMVDERYLLLVRHVFGDEHLEMAKACGNAANRLLAQDRFEEAREHYERTYAILEAKLGVSHVQTNRTLVQIGICFNEERNHTQVGWDPESH